jgi:hypothetical protein
MRRYCARGLAASALFISAIGCHDSLVKPLPVSAATAQTGTTGTVIASTPEIIATNEQLAGQMVAGDTVSLKFESDGTDSYVVSFPKKTPKKSPACNPTTIDVTAEYPVKPGAPFTCYINHPTQSGGKVYYKIGKFKSLPDPPPLGPAPTPTPTPTPVPFSVVHCRNC